MSRKTKIVIGDVVSEGHFDLELVITGAEIQITMHGQQTQTRTPAGSGAVSAAMEQAGVAVFLAAERVQTLGSSLSRAYEAMDEVRRCEIDEDD